MPGLTVHDVRVMAIALGLSPDDEDLVEITHRLNAFVKALAPLGALALVEVEPVPIEPNRMP